MVYLFSFIYLASHIGGRYLDVLQKHEKALEELGKETSGYWDPLPMTVCEVLTLFCFFCLYNFTVKREIN
jgi:hypothetical protein